MAPALLVPLDLAGFIIQLCGNAIVTTLIITRIWYLSPRRRRDVLGANFPTGTGRAAIAIIIESGMLYFSVQLVYCILFSTGSHAVGVIGEIAVQIYVSIRHRKGNCCLLNTNHTGHRTITYFYPNVWLVKSAFIWTD